MFEDLIDNKGKKENVVDKDELIDAMKEALKGKDKLIKGYRNTIIKLRKDLKYLTDL